MMNRNPKRVRRQLLNMLDGSMSFILISSIGADDSARRQLAFDIWWLAFALWLVCIIEV